MPDQPAAPASESEVVAASPAAVPAAEARQEPEPSSVAPSLFERLFGRRQTAERAAAPESSPAAQERETQPDQEQSDQEHKAPPDAEQPNAEAKTLTLSEEELERRIQAEADRREAKRARAQRVDPVKELEARERAERQQDPWKAAETRNQMDAMAAQREFVGGLVRTYDAATLDPLMALVPEAERQKLLAAEPDTDPLEHRQRIVRGGLAAYEKAIRADEAKKTEERIRRNPSVLKQVVLDTRDERDEPVLVAAGSARRNGATTSMDDLIRGAARRGGTGGGVLNPYQISDED